MSPKTEKIDITKDHCPMTFVKTRLKLDTLETGDLLEVLLKAGDPLENVPRTAKEQGHKVISIDQVENTIYKVTLEKGQ